METRARFVLIGLFTIAGFLSALGFVLWIAKFQLDRTYAQYDIVFDTVAGLGQASAVRYNGVDVGKVLTIALDRTDPSLVRVRIEIIASTPVRADTVATLASQGLTGVSFIALAGGSATAPPLLPLPGADLPVILSEKSVVQDLMISGPDLLAQATALISEIRTFSSAENRAAVAAILVNAEAASDRIDGLATRVDTVLQAIEATLARADETLAAASKGFATAEAVLSSDIAALIDRVTTAADSAGDAADGFAAFARRDLPQIATRIGAVIRSAETLIASTDSLVRQIGANPGRFLLGNQTPDYRR